MRKSILTVAAVSLLLGWFGRPTAVLACSCVSATPAEHFANATTVFMGTVKNISGDGRNGQKRLVDFAVTEARKGILDKTVTVATGAGGGDCGFDFQEGQEYVVYAYDDGGKLGTGICSGTALVNDASDNVDESLMNNISEGSMEEVEEGSNLLVTTVVLGAAFGAGMLMMHLWGRRRL